MTTTASISFPNNPVLLHFKEELHKSPAAFERKKKLYYIAAVISGIVATAFFLSFIPLQTMMLPCWLSIAGSAITQSAGLQFAKIAHDMIQIAQEAGKVASRLREMQNIYQTYQETSLSEPEKIIMAHATFAEKEYAEAEQSLQELVTNTNFSSPKSRIEEVIQLQHQVLLLKIDVCFKVAVSDVIATGDLDCLTEKKDLLLISDQDPLKRNQIQGLNEVLKKKLTEPLVRFTKFDLFRNFENLFFEEVEKMPPDELASHLFEIMTTPSSFSELA
ncbi:MAG TPA: hypothetical protein VGZ69_00810 [Candidatus Rhabdochlamydia sp.]|jgi:hypothetical protein|nr:hypothetical protein [Candidatus Rhabdochlamydia sp.]